MLAGFTDQVATAPALRDARDACDARGERAAQRRAKSNERLAHHLTTR